MVQTTINTKAGSFIINADSNGATLTNAHGNTFNVPSGIPFWDADKLTAYIESNAETLTAKAEAQLTTEALLNALDEHLASLNDKGFCKCRITQIRNKVREMQA